MKRLLAAAIVFCAATPALGWPARTPQAPHPAVVRVIALEDGGASCGSGALVGVNDTYGLIVTNWHVVRDTNGAVFVLFPDGFRSGAIVLRADRDWDLAALAVWRPNVQPITVAADPPQPGDLLTIAGYGSGTYRAATGRCTQYVSPGRDLPFQMVELDKAARSGDSGGPIFNARGELAGVLFGAGFGHTAGSYCGRVRWFLASVVRDFQRLPSNQANQTMIAQQPSSAPAVASQPPPPLRGPIGSIVGVRPCLPPPKAATAAIPPPSARPELAQLPQPRLYPGPAAQGVPAGLPSPQPAQAPGPTRGEQIKTILAAIGVLALLLHSLRILGAATKT